MAKSKDTSKQKKINVRVDFTPMVDMMMLLITFFMLCTSLAKPQTMELSMPSNDKNMTDQDKSVTKASYTITVYVAGNNKIFYTAGLPKYDDPSTLKETTWGKDGIRKVFMQHVTEDNTQPVLQVMKAKAELDQKKDQMPDSVYKQELTKIKAGEIGGQKIQTMTVIIKATDKALAQNVIDALDEMQICSIAKYVLDKISPDDAKLLKSKGVE
ncbi:MULTISPECIES: biopolymer transporter ExbD [Prevotellaceae]|uniref:ExbD/TolR family protein n=1 Tax=Prevotellaceae TaxID=171552 RepID=UPI0003B90EA7|nr:MULTISPECIES: biopolymer transporter ExbD [Prevotellaceae]ERT58263.1 transport energizing protein, ExbD/TolR family [Prevotella sp. BV3P1]KGF40051.1 biopolymer transporter ExbD [Hoylesella buccalis DNF00985]